MKSCTPGHLLVKGLYTSTCWKCQKKSLWEVRRWVCSTHGPYLYNILTLIVYLFIFCYLGIFHSTFLWITFYKYLSSFIFISTSLFGHVLKIIWRTTSQRIIRIHDYAQPLHFLCMLALSCSASTINSLGWFLS